jgi:peptide/nickel transport system permease protein
VKSYIVGHVLQLVLVLVGVSMVVFITMRVLPGDVAHLLLGEQATLEDLTRIRQQLGLDQPIWVQYLHFAARAVQGDLGESIRTHRPALQEVWRACPVTLQLTFVSLVLATLLGIPLGTLAAMRPGGAIDSAVMALTLLGVSVPIFWLGLMMLLLFGATLGWLPIGGSMPTGMDPPYLTGMSVVDSVLSGRSELIWASLRYLVLPAITLASIPLALITRITRAEVLGAATLDHVRTARSKGMREYKVVVRHILRNAMIPVTTVIGLQAGLLLSGAVLTETIYALPGLGRLMVDSILNRDYPVVEAAALVTALIFVLVNLLVDLSYGLLDPRIRRA